MQQTDIKKLLIKQRKQLGILWEATFQINLL